MSGDRKPKQRKGHRPFKRRRMVWPYCIKCGLLYLNNDVTRRAIRGPCEGDNYSDREDDDDV